MECPNCFRPIYKYKIQVIKEKEKELQYLCPECSFIIKKSEKKTQEWEYVLILIIVIPLFFFSSIFITMNFPYSLPLYIAFFYLVFEVAIAKLNAANKIINKQTEKNQIIKHLKFTVIFLLIYYLISGTYNVIQVKMNGGNFVMSEQEISLTYLIAFLIFLRLIFQAISYEEAKKKIRNNHD